MFGGRFLNKIINGNGNIQVSGDVDRIEIGISFKEHLDAVERRVDEVRREQADLRIARESLIKAEADLAQAKIDLQQLEIEKLNDIIRDPQKYIDYTEDAKLKLGILLRELEENQVNGNIEGIRREIKAGSFEKAGQLIEVIENSPNLNMRLKAELLSARATLAFFDLRFDEAEGLLRRAFYVEPDLNNLVAMLDQMDMNGSRERLLVTFRDARAVLPVDLDPHSAVRILAVEAWISATAGELAYAKSTIKAAESAMRKLPTTDNEATIQLTVCKASIAALEEDQTKALNYFRIALKILRDSDEEDDLYFTRIEANIGACLAELGRLEEAVSITRDCVEKLRKSGDIGRYHLGIRLNNLGDFLVRSGNAEEAVDIINESIDLAEKNLPLNHPSLIRRRLNLAIALGQLGRVQSAIAVLRSIKVDEAMLNEIDWRSLARANCHLFEFYVETEKWMDALSAALEIQKIGPEYLGDKALIEALPKAISTMRHAIISGDFRCLRTSKEGVFGVSNIHLR